MAVATSVALAVGVTALAGGINAGIKKKAAKDEMAKQAQIANDKKLALEELEKNRQDVINPAENMANEWDNLGVATQAARFEAEEADIALANTLDTIAQTGGGAGGATALARMALESKRGISQSIEKQEKENQDAAAAGAAEVQAAKIQGDVFKWNAQEARDDKKDTRLYNEQKMAEYQEGVAKAANLQATMDMVNVGADALGGLQGGFTGAGGLFDTTTSWP
jgi:hypothetical protein